MKSYFQKVFTIWMQNMSIENETHVDLSKDKEMEKIIS